MRGRAIRPPLRMSLRSIAGTGALRHAAIVCLASLCMPRVAWAEPSCPKGTRSKTHVVARGDTLSGIINEHGMLIADVVRDNPGLNPDSLSEGQKLLLCIPKATRRRAKRCRGGGLVHEHRVRSGDNLHGIALRYGVEEQSLLKDNPDLKEHPDQLREGQTISVCAQAARLKNSKACKYRTPLHYHEVVPGEWLAEIASRYGVRQRDIQRLNAKLRGNPDYLRPGQRLRVCPDIAPRTRERIHHDVRSGETIASIAARYDVSPQQLIRFQQGRLKNPDELSIGQRLVVWQDGGIVEGFADEDDEAGGALPNGIQLPPGRHYEVKSSNLAWGTPATIRLIQAAVSKYERRIRGPVVHIGDISRKGGGRFPPHKSHRTGQDVDVGYVVNGGDYSNSHFVRATKSNLDAKHTWALLNAFLDTDHVRYVFMDYNIQGWLYDYAKKRGVSQRTLDELFQYPRGKRRAYGIIRDDPGHDDHFHVRFQ